MHTTTTAISINDALTQLLAPRDERTLCLPGFSGVGWGEFQLSLAQFEGGFQDARAAFELSLESDTLAERLPPDDPRQCPLVWERQGKQGGAHRRPPPPVLELIAAAAGGESRRRVSGGCPDAELGELAELLHFVHLHRGRGLSDTDEAYQREWCVARSLGVGYFISKGERGDRVGLPAAVRTKLGRPVASRLDFLAWVVESKRLGYFGLYISAPEFARTTGHSTRTFWRAVKWAESKGFITVLRTYKDGLDRPVGLDRNWYGAGPALRELASAYMPAQAELFDADEHAKLSAEWKADVKRRAARQRRGVARQLGFYSRLEFAEQVVEAADAHERAEWEHRKNEAAIYAEADQLRDRVHAGELPEHWLDVGAAINARLGALGDPPVLRVPRVVVDVARVLLNEGRKLGAWLREGVGVLYDRAAAALGRLLVRDGEEIPGGSLPFEHQAEELGLVFAGGVELGRELGEQRDEDLVGPCRELGREQRDEDLVGPCRELGREQLDGDQGRELASSKKSVAAQPFGGGPPMTQRHEPPEIRGTSTKQGKPALRASTTAPERGDPPEPERDEAPTSRATRSAEDVRLSQRDPDPGVRRASSRIATGEPSHALPAANLGDEDQRWIRGLGWRWADLAGALLADYRTPKSSP